MRLKQKTFTMIFTAVLCIFLMSIVSCDGGGSGEDCAGDTGTIRTPDLRNLDESEAQSAIAAAGLTMGTISNECSDAVGVGKVALQDPAAGDRVDPGTVVNVSVSNGLLCDVRFSDPVLRATIRRALDLDENEPISESALKTLEELNATNWEFWLPGIFNLEGIQYCSNLRILHISDNSIMDISPLSGLINLESLDISANPISSIDALAGLTNLHKLSMGASMVVEYSLTELGIDLNNLTDFQKLIIGYTQITPLKSLDALSGLTNLQSLSITEGLGRNVVNLDAIAGLSNLRRLYLDGNYIVNIDALAGLSNLEIVNLDENSIVDISAVAKLPNLSMLLIRDNAIEDLAPFVENSGLCVTSRTSISFNNNPINAKSCDDYIPELLSRGMCAINHSCYD